MTLILVAAILVGSLLAVSVSAVPLMIASALPWLLVVRQRVGLVLALPATLIGAAWMLLVLMLVNPVWRVPLLLTITLVAVLGGVAGCIVFLGRGSDPIPGQRSSLGPWLAPLTGSVIWLATLVASVLVPGASRYSWVMVGDSANNILFARAVLVHQGLAVGPNENPVPLPSGVLTLGLLSGRSDIAPSELLKHDIAGFVVVWGLLIALTCYLTGVAVAATIRSTSPVVTSVSVGAASLLPLTWLFTGYPLEYGFFNTHLILPVILAAWIVTIRSESAPTMALVLNLLASTLMLSIWSPLVLLPLSMAIVVLTRNWSSLIRARGVGLGVLLAAAAQLAAYGVIVVLPGLLAQGEFLAAQGGVYPLNKLIVLTCLAGAGGVGLAAVLRLEGTLGWPLLAFAGGSATGLGALLFLSRNAATPWTYYPTKFAWLVSIVSIVLILGVAVRLIARTERHWIVAASVAMLAIVTASALNWAPRAVLSYPWMNPIDRILTGQFIGHGDDVAAQIFAAADPEHPTVLWHSGNPNESAINFWLLQMAAGELENSTPLREFAYGYYDDSRTEDLCRIVDEMGERARVITAETDLGARLADSCSGADVDIIEVMMSEG